MMAQGGFAISVSTVLVGACICRSGEVLGVLSKFLEWCWEPCNMLFHVCVAWLGVIWVDGL